jgi:hypothetical protein
VKVLIITVLALACGAHAVGQNKIWSLGIEAGANFSKFGMEAPENEHRTGLLGGLFVTYSVVNTFGVTGKILYSEKGSKAGSTEQILKYVEVPLIGRFFLNQEGKFRPNIFIGPSFGFLRGAATKVGDNEPTKLRNYNDTYNEFDLGATAGLGLNLLIAPHCPSY